jgi:hypothetical protein
MIYDPNIKKWFHFGSSDYSDYTKHKDKQRRLKFKTRNKRWAESDIYSSAYSSYTLLW